MSRIAFYGLILQVTLLGLLKAEDLPAQLKSIYNIKVSVDFKEASLKEIFSELERQTSFYFAYEKSLLDERHRINLSSKNISLGDVLHVVAGNTNLGFKRINSTIHVSKRQRQQKDVVDVVPDPQSIFTVSGTVTDAAGVTLPGVNVLLKGTITGTSTDANGKYAFEIPDGNGTLVFSYIGYTTREIDIDNRNVIDVTLESDVQTLAEIVVIGYGTQEKRDLTGAVSSVDKERLQDIPANNVVGALQGTAAGVSISTPFGAPGSGSSILIRGLNSINASNDPLIVVDGIPGGSINDINPNDIASIDVLKDAASTSIYGSRATNGVIIITTKTGKSGKLSVSYDGYVGFSKPLKKVDMLNVNQFIERQREIRRMVNNLTADAAAALTVTDILVAGSSELEMFDLGKSYNWQEEILQPAPQHGHNISLSGGSDKTRFYMAASAVSQEGIVQSSGFERYSIRANVDSDVTPWMRLGTNLFLTKSKQDVVPGTVFDAAFQINPLGRKYIDEVNRGGQFALHPVSDVFITNPFTEMTMDEVVNRTKILNGTFVEVSFLKNFKYKITANSILDYERNNYFVPFYTRQVEAFSVYEFAEIEDWDRSYFNLENLLTYSKKFGEHDLAFTAVFTTEEYQQDRVFARGLNFGSDYYGWTALQLGQATSFQAESGEEKWFLESTLGRLNYSFKDKYLVQATIRRDRSSKFGSNNRDAVFPGISVGWRISGEPFMQNIQFINDLKLRVSYAVTGNQSVDYLSRYSRAEKVRYSLSNGTVAEGFDQTTLGNKGLKWEESSQFNTGVDFQVLNGRLSGAVEVYRTTTKDLLMNRSIQWLNGYPSIFTNIGSVRNQGVEVSLNGGIIETSNFKMRANAAFSKNHNEIIELYGDGVDDVQNRWFIGKPLGVVYDYVFDGILQPGETAPAHMDNTVGIVGDNKNILPGEAKVKDIGGYQTVEGATVITNVPDGQINEADMTIIGYTQPKWFGSFGMQFNYKNFDASFFFNHVHGTMRSIPLTVAQRAPMLDLPYYTDENPNAQYGRPAWPNSIDGITRAGNRFGYLSYYQNGTYTRLQDVTIGYTLRGLSNLGLNSVRIYATGQNLLTITDFIGYDPSLNFTNNQRNGEIARISGYPTSRNFIMGVKLNF